MSSQNQEESLDDERVRRIVRDELRNTDTEEASSTRRDAIKAGGILGLGLLGGGGAAYGATEAIGTAKAATGSGTIGTESDPVKTIYANDFGSSTEPIQNLYANKQTSLDVGTLNADELLGTYPGKVRAIADTSIVASIDPANTTTPVQDAINAINNNGGDGIVTLPGGTITDASPGLSGLRDIVIEGRGMQATTLELTDTTSAGVHITTASDLRNGGFRNLTLSGSSAANRTVTEPALHIDATNYHVIMDHVILADWVREFWFDTGDIYSSYWPFVVSNPTEEVLVHDAAARSPGLEVGHWFVSPDAAITNQALFDINTNTQLTIGTLNAGSNAGRLVHIADTAKDYGGLQIGNLNFESAQTVTEVFYLGANKHIFRLGQAQFGGGGTADQFFNIGGGGYNYIGLCRKPSFTVNNNWVNVTADTAGASPTVTELDSAVVSDSSGVTLTQPVACLGDLTTVS